MQLIGVVRLATLTFSTVAVLGFMVLAAYGGLNGGVVSAAQGPRL